MTTDLDSREYVSSVTLMFLGEDLDPRVVSKALRLRPTQQWRRGEPKLGAEDQVHEWGGWKRALPNSLLSRSIEHQLAYWLRLLTPRRRSLAKLRADHDLCALSCYVGSGSTASIILLPEFQSALASLSLELQLSFFGGAHDA